IKDGGGTESESAGNNSINKTDAPSDLFGNNKSDWYFDNASLKSKGFTDFKNKFGSRPNVDNWRRSSAIASAQSANNKDPKSIDFGKEGNPGASDSAGIISFEALMKNLPLTEEQMKVSRDSMEKATFQLGKMYFESLEDYEGTIITLEELLGKYPATIHKAEALFILHYCYTKTGNIAKANETKQVLEKDFSGSEYQKIVTNPKGGSQRSNELIAITKQYDEIYNDFIEGRFGKAIEDKKAADSMYGVTYWTPQLLYIESVYYIKQKDDPKAKIVLQDIIKLYPNNEMASRAQTMLDVLARRKEIEEYLTNLKIERPGEDSAIVINNQPLVKRVEVEVTDSAAIAELEKQAAAQKLEDKLKSKDSRTKISDKKDSIGTSGIKVVAKDLAGIQNNDANAKRAAEMLRADSLASAAAEKKFL
ncbi:MAG: tetratricopeptide repeat protein, partial [Chitinophagaceae bacterium]